MHVTQVEDGSAYEASRLPSRSGLRKKFRRVLVPDSAVAGSSKVGMMPSADSGSVGMFIRLKGRAVPLVLLVVSSLWAAALVFPLVYSLLLPNADIRHIIRAFEGRETLRKELAPLATVTNSVGRLKHAIQIGAYWGASAEYKHGESHTTKTTELSYLAWFEKRPKPMIFIVTRTEVDGATVRFNTDEGSLLGMLRVYLVPVAILALSLYWFLRTRSRGRRFVAASNGPPSQEGTGGVAGQS